MSHSGAPGRLGGFASYCQKISWLSEMRIEPTRNSLTVNQLGGEGRQLFLRSILCKARFCFITTAAAAILAGTSVALSQGNQGEARPDAIAEAQTPKEAPMERPEQKKTAHDLSDVFNPSKAVPSSEALTVLELKLTAEEKHNLVEFMRQL
jgi:hypothetical protein